MNRQRAKELLPIIQAFAEGKKIQVFDFDGQWTELELPQFDETSEYRIKPEPTEIWVNLYYSGVMQVFFTREAASREAAGRHTMSTKHFREVTE